MTSSTILDEVMLVEFKISKLEMLLIDAGLLLDHQSQPRPRIRRGDDLSCSHILTHDVLIEF